MIANFCILTNISRSLQHVIRICSTLHEQSFAIFYIYNPFTREPEIAPTDLQFELIDLQESSEARTSSHALSLSVSAYPTIRRHAQHIGSLYEATYIL